MWCVPYCLKAAHIPFPSTKGAMQVLLTYMPADRAQRLPACISSQDSRDLRPLDLALATQQWPAVRLLISAGALQTCPELTQAQRELQQQLQLPDSRRHSGPLVLLVGTHLFELYLDLHILLLANVHFLDVH